MAHKVIHEIIGYEFLKKQKNIIKNREEFLKGIVAPDFNEDFTGDPINKDITHYGKWTNGNTEIHFNEFLKDSKVDISSDYWKGYFHHLLTDDYFYNDIFSEEFNKIKQDKKTTFQNEFYCISKNLIEYYKYTPSKYVQNSIKYNNNEPLYLKLDKTIDFIKKMSELNLKTELEKIVCIKEYNL